MEKNLKGFLYYRTHLNKWYINLFVFDLHDESPAYIRINISYCLKNYI